MTKILNRETIYNEINALDIAISLLEEQMSRLILIRNNLSETQYQDYIKCNQHITNTNTRISIRIDWRGNPQLVAYILSHQWRVPLVLVPERVTQFCLTYRNGLYSNVQFTDSMIRYVYRKYGTNDINEAQTTRLVEVARQRVLVIPAPKYCTSYQQ